MSERVAWIICSYNEPTLFGPATAEPLDLLPRSRHLHPFVDDAEIKQAVQDVDRIDWPPACRSRDLSLELRPGARAPQLVDGSGHQLKLGRSPPQKLPINYGENHVPHPTGYIQLTDHHAVINRKTRRLTYAGT